MIIQESPSSIEGRENIQCLPLTSLLVEDWMQIRAKGLHAATVEQYRTVIRNIERGGDKLPPITVVLLDGLYLVADGFHRRRAHEIEGQYRIDCIVMEVSTHAEAVWIAAEGNLKHGLRLTSKEKRAAFGAFISARKHREAGPAKSRQRQNQRPRRDIMSLGEIAAALGVNKSSAMRWMEEDFKREYGLLYKRGRDVGVGEEAGPGAPYDVFRGETPQMVAKDALVRLTASAPHLTSEDDLRSLAVGLATAMAGLAEQHGTDKMKALIEGATAPSDWMFTPPPKEADSDF